MIADMCCKHLMGIQYVGEPYSISNMALSQWMAAHASRPRENYKAEKGN